MDLSAKELSGGETETTAKGTWTKAALDPFFKILFNIPCLCIAQYRKLYILVLYRIVPYKVNVKWQ
jgi:hypothetical protein